MEDLPTELLIIIAKNAGKNCRYLWLNFPAIRPVFPDMHHVFIDRVTTAEMIMTKMFWRLQSINDEPALIKYTDGGALCSVGWYDRGVLHRGDDLPAYIDVAHHDVAWCKRGHAGSVTGQCTVHKIWQRPGVIRRIGGLPVIHTKWGCKKANNNYINNRRCDFGFGCRVCAQKTVINCAECYGNADYYVKLTIAQYDRRNMKP